MSATRHDHDLAQLPSKLYFRIGEVAGLVGVEPHVLRYWEREFRSIRPTKSAKGQRVYSRKDVENLLRVRDLLYRDGFTIAGAKKKLSRAGGAPDAEAAAEVELAGAGAREVETALEAQVESVAIVAEPVTAPRVELTAEARTALEALRADIVAFLDELPADA